MDLNKKTQEHLIDVFNEALENKEKLEELKHLCIEAGWYGLASVLRDIYLEKYPETKEAAEAELKGIELSMVFNLVQLNVPIATAWTIHEAMKKYLELGDKFSIDDAAKIIAKRKEYFKK